MAACDSTIDLGHGAPGSVGSDGGGGTPTCEGVCQKLSFCGFVEPGQGDACLGECRARGTPAELACAQSAACSEIQSRCGSGQGAADAAFDSFNEGLEAFEITQCQEGCNHLAFFDCVNASEHATCRSLCETVARSKRASFESCANNSGSDCSRGHNCFDVLRTP